jgi:lipopolysaccharide transport system ATP-binding protein
MSISGNNIAIEVKNLSKIFKIYSRPSDLLTEILFRKPRHREFLALNNLSFKVQRGEVVGLVGRNGAGKSTLLRILAGTLDKTSGEMRVRGNLSAILELGSGFNPDYTGLENIRMGGLCLGMSRKEVDARTDWIIEFSELRDFINQPFRTYSSGMQARLTFATAAALEPDILIVDEALSVGDARFQLKCFSYLRDLCVRGSTVLLVSHDTNAITSLCTRAIFLEQGTIKEMGDPQTVTAHYLKFLYGLNNSAEASEALRVAAGGEGSPELAASPDEGAGEMLEPGRASSPPEDGEPPLVGDRREKAEIRSLEIVDNAGNVVSMLKTAAPYRVVMRVLFHEQVDTLSVGFLIRNRQGVELFGFNTNLAGIKLPPGEAGARHEYSLKVIMNMVNGPYFLSGTVASRNAEGYWAHEDVWIDHHSFEVMSPPPRLHDISVVNLNPIFSVEAQRPA